MRNKVIFLDIDGVLCSARSSVAYGGYPTAGNARTWDRFDPVAICLLRKVVDETGASVVLCSRWREEVNVDTLEFVLGIAILGVTRAGNGSDIRGDQVNDWLIDHPDVERYALLDDKEDYHQAQMDKLCRTSFRNGFLLGHYEELCELLGYVTPVE